MAQSGVRPKRFQKQILSAPIVSSQIKSITEFLSAVENLWRIRLLDDAEFTGIYLIYFAWLNNPYAWFMADRKLTGKRDQVNVPEPLLAILPETIRQTLIRAGSINLFFNNFRLRSIPENARVVMQKWFCGEWKLKVLTQEADALQMLENQSQGQRLITLFVNRENILQGAPHGRDVFSFALHDLMHAYEFFHHPESRDSQIGLYRLFLKAHKQGLFDEILKSPAQESLMYVFSDLNAYALHMFRAFKGVVRKYYEGAGKTQFEFEVFLKGLFDSWRIPEPYREKLIFMNSETPLSPGEERVLLDFFMGCSKVVGI